MKEKVESLIQNEIKDLDLWVSDVKIEKKGGNTYFEIELDSNTIIDLNRIVDASNIINPIMDEANLLDGEYILDIYAKEKGDVV